MILRARRAVLLTFLLNGFGVATWFSQVPAARTELGLSNQQLGLLLLVAAAGSVLALPTTGAFVNRWGAERVVRVGVTLTVVALLGLAVGVGGFTSVTLTASSLFLFGVGLGTWDVAMNVQGAVVERRLARNVMPHFHAAFSVGTVLGAGVGALVLWAGIGIAAHLGFAALVLVIPAYLTTGWFLDRGPRITSVASSGAEHTTGTAAWRAWLEPRTLLIGLMVLSLALTEGAANDWLALALIDGHNTPGWLGVAGFGLFVLSMTIGRLLGPSVLDRYGRAVVLWATMASAGVGVLLLVLGTQPVIVVLGIVLWGLGASLGFPVGISAAAEDPVHAAARVSVVSTIGYLAFLGGPPLLGFVAERVGTLDALLVVALLLVPSALVVPATREPRPATRPR